MKSIKNDNRNNVSYLPTTLGSIVRLAVVVSLFIPTTSPGRIISFFWWALFAGAVFSRLTIPLDGRGGWWFGVWRIFLVFLSLVFFWNFISLRFVLSYYEYFICSLCCLQKVKNNFIRIVFLSLVSYLLPKESGWK